MTKQQTPRQLLSDAIAYLQKDRSRELPSKTQGAPYVLYISPRIFFAPMLPILRRMLKSVPSLSFRRAVSFLSIVYFIAERVNEIKETIEFQRENHRALRKLRIAYGDSRASVRNALRNLKRAKSRIRTELADEFRATDLNFRDSESSLENLESRLGIMESVSALLINPQFRNASDKAAAEKANLDIVHLDLRITKKSIALQALALELIDLPTRAHFGDTVRVREMDRFIQQFLKASLGTDIKPDNLKTIRSRIKAANEIKSI
jgi:hypothetical protein